MINYFYDCYTILNKVYSEKAFIKQAISSTQIEEKNRSLVIKTVYGVLDKDIELTYCIKQYANQTPKLAIRTILKISMYAIKYLNKKEYAVVKNAVELVKKLGKGGASGFVNAFLHKFISEKFELPTKLEDNFSIKYSYPLFAVKELINDYGKHTTESLISAENAKNTLVFYELNGKEYLESLGVSYELTPFDNVYSVANFVRNEDFQKGLYTFQALGSVAICEEIPSCNKLLDCCSAPGGKSVRLSYRTAEVHSWDIHEHRVQLINDYKQRMNRGNIYPSVNDSKVYNKDLDEFYDVVLCDVPCSGLGVVNDNPDMKLNRKKEDIELLNLEQLAILSTVANYVKVDGYLIYSTCSVLKKENIDIVSKFLLNDDRFVIEKIDSKLPHVDIQGTNQFLPHISGGLGFYIAKLKRVK